MQDNNDQPDQSDSITPTPPNPFGAPPSNPMQTPTPPAPASAPTPAPFSPTPPPISSPDPAPTPFGPQPSEPALTPSPTPVGGSKKKLFIIIAVAVLLLIIVAVAAYLIFGKPTNNSVDSSAKTASSTPANVKEEITATKINEFSDVCNGKKIANAPTLKTPNKTVPFVSDGTDTWSIFLYSLEENDRLTTTISEASVVACALPDESTATVAKKCTPTNFSTKEKLNVDYKGVTYELTFYAAQTGEKISSAKIVTSNDTCMTYALESGVQYAIPSEAEATPIFNTFFAAH